MLSILEECKALAGENGHTEHHRGQPVEEMHPIRLWKVCSDNWTHPYSREKAAYPLS
jgi:hypothetical protein